MLINVSAKNFKSFDNTERLSMISSSKIQTHGSHIREIKGTKILKMQLFTALMLPGNRI